MRCINDHVIKSICFLTAAGMSILLTACGKKPQMAFEDLPEGSVYGVTEIAGGRVEPFSQDLCIVEGKDQSLMEDGKDKDYASAGLFDVNGCDTRFSDNVFEQLYPASMTKVMTAIIAMENGSEEDIVTCSENVKITESGAQLCGFEPGDSMNLDQALHALLMYSGNDAAVAIAEHFAVSEEAFADMMNAEAKRLGATHTHFVNPHGLHNEEHYTTAYDMYLMFNKAITYEWFQKIINEKEYTFNYRTAAGDYKEMTFKSTNLFLKGDVLPPGGVNVIGGKTGTTMAAGNNLVMLSEDETGRPYISIVMRARERGILYSHMNQLLDKIDE
ncbi:MAG: D-alanyl-D-alanine carboxypeptidase [Lachnospiraceae bacterium]|nr:D-alanyl-D-alanine carboxypeptidase [Lachnospiraceae bacterium]MBR4175073.1 D-alanyl-D-alanine carboxypeptidase [Lachnospiraceae bacterium]